MRTPLRKYSLLALVALGCLAGALLVPAAPRAVTGDCVPGAGWPAARADLAGGVLAAINAYRATIGRRPLTVSPSLAAAAVWKARHMAQYRYMAHDDPAPPIARPTDARIAACGYAGAGWGENIAAGFPTPQAVVQGWLASPGHRANIEQAGFVTTGIGAAVASNGAVFWAQTFGTSGAGAPPTPPAPPRPPASSSPPSRPGRATTAAPVRQLRVARSPDRRAARVDRLYLLRFPVRALPGAARVTRGGVVCRASVGRRHAKVVAAGFRGGFARCILVAPRRTRGLHLAGTMHIRASHLHARHWFSRLVR
jgi:uncharacterized protein YkwD